MKICPNCGSPINYCVSACLRAESDARREQELAFLEQILEPSAGIIQLEFLGTLDDQRLLVNRLRAEWPWAIQVIEPTPDYPHFLANLGQDLNGPLNVVYKVSLDGIVPSQEHADWTAFFNTEVNNVR